MVATTWSYDALVDVEARSGLGRQIDWVVLQPGEGLASLVDRRGGVDVILGGSMSDLAKLGEEKKLVACDPSDASLWRIVSTDDSTNSSFLDDFRDDPIHLTLAKRTLKAEGWPKGFETLIRQTVVGDTLRRVHSTEQPDHSAKQGRSAGRALPGVALLKSGRNPNLARKLLRSVDAQPAPTDSNRDAAIDSLIADYLGAALVDASDERLEAISSLDRFHHPTVAESSLGERGPWPPASVGKLMQDPTGELLETLLEQIAPDVECRTWLQESWSGENRRIDGDLLTELANAVDGRLAREPRFRAWLRSEWTAWHRQLYRRVARLAGGYVPS